MLKILATALKKDKGKIVMGGKDFDIQSDAVCSDIGYLPQNFDFFKRQRLYEAMEYIAMLKGMQKPYGDEIEKLLYMVHLQDERNKTIGELSGGMKQRFGIAQSLLNHPSIVIMDEPTVGLDPGERIHFRNIITSLDWECSVIISSHIVSDIETFSDKVILMKEGKLLFYGSQEEAIDEMQGKVVTVKQEGNVPIAWEKNVISVRKRAHFTEIRMIIDESVKMSDVTSAVSYVEPTLEDFYFQKMYMRKRDESCGKNYKTNN